MNLKSLTAYTVILIAMASFTMAENQKIGSYEIKESEKKLSSTCSDYSRSDIVYSESEFTKGQRDTAHSHSWARDYMDRYIKTREQSELVDLGTRAALRYGFIAIFIPLSILSFIVLFIFFFCKACCSALCTLCGCCATKKASEQKKKRPSKKMIPPWLWRSVIGCLSFIVVVIIIVLSLLWMIQTLKTINSLRKTDCMSSHVIGDIRVGVVDTKAGVTFGGVLGIKYTLQEVIKSLDTLPDTQNIINRDLKTKSQTLKDSLKPFYDSYKASTIESPTTALKQVKPLCISTLTEDIQPYIGQEVNVLANTSISIHEGAVAAKEVSGPQVAEFKKAINSVIA